MDCCKPKKVGNKRSQAIDDDIRDANQNALPKLRLLLLGTGDSGKSTFLKQMKVLHKDGFSQSELDKYRAILPINALGSMQQILAGYVEACAVSKKMRIKSKMKEHFDKVRSAEELTPEVANSIEILWNFDEINMVFESRTDYHINVPSACPYYFTNAKRFADRDYVPTNEDIFNAKVRTTGATDIVFETGCVEFTLVDVGGQRSERRKWLHCFDDVTSVLFLTALDEYDMVLEEDQKQNRLQESLHLFTQVSSSQFFEQSSWILFLNKNDLFIEKIKKYPLHKFFSDISEKDVSDYESSLAYITQKYVAAFRGPGPLYHFATCNIDTRATEKLFVALRDTIITKALQESSNNV